MNLRDYTDFRQRNEAVEKECNISLEQVKNIFIDEPEQVHCENLIGAVSIPLGVAGPLKINGNALKRETYLPLATTEGALVASVSRGAKAITESGGANVNAYRLGATRGPVFYTGSLAESSRLNTWIRNNEATIREVAESTSAHLKFKKAQVRGLADHVFVRFSFDTHDAMGMNMVTIATQKIVELIEQETGIAALAVAGNYDIDKKPAWMNFLYGRGFEAWAEVTVPKTVVETVLKSSAQKMFDVWLGKCMLGSAMSGSLGFNSHFANMVAAFFAATGQDLAHVVEGSHGMTTARVLENGDLYFSVFMPAIMLGTVGGGTKLKTQTEARSITGAQTSEELAEVLIGAVLAGELSLLASLSQGSLAKAHKKLGR